jgi:ribose-phosphate pyrophosphokinase
VVKPPAAQRGGIRDVPGRGHPGGGEDLADAVIAAPDLGASKYARRIRQAIGSRYQIAIVDKERDNGATPSLDFIDQPVKGRRVIMFDDIIDTGGPILGAA